jgi:Uma2 family endonuclease
MSLVQTDWTAADVMDHFGPILLRRIRRDPAPGTATEQHLIEVHNRDDRLYELIDGVLVEKTAGAQESYLAMLLGQFLGNFLATYDLGFVLGADGMLRLAPGLVRLPDLAFISWRRLPGREIPNQPILGLAPDLAVEVLSPSNTKREMERKLGEYFAVGVQLVWYVDPPSRTVRVFASPGESVLLDEGQTLDGGQVLPGFALPLRELFARLG